MKNKAVLIPVGLAVAGLIGLGAIESNKKAQSARANNLRNAELCIRHYSSVTIKGTVPVCEKVKTEWLTEEQKAQHSTAYSKHKEVIAEQEAEAMEKAAIAKAEADAAAAKAKAERDARIAKAAAEREARGEWTYSGYTDDATGKRAKTARLTSKNSMNFDSPYEGTQYGRFTIRNHPRYGVDAYLSIDEGQLLCDSYSNTTVLIRFDNGAATRYSCGEPADHSSDTVFIHNVAGLEARMKTAKKMYITVSVYQEGSRTWEFNVKGYNRNKV